MTKTEPIIPLDIRFGNEPDLTNPYHIRDGKWGGMGGKHWFRYEDKGVPFENVYEDDRKGRWVRCWDSELQKWRKLTKTERVKLKRKPRKLPVFRDCQVRLLKTLPKDPAAVEAFAAFLSKLIPQRISEPAVIEKLFNPTPSPRFRESTTITGCL